MNCLDVEHCVDDFVDGLLDGSEAEQVERHLFECPECQEALDSLRALLAEAASLPRDITPERDLWPDILIRAKAKPKRLWWRTVAACAAAATLLLVAAVILTCVPGSPRQTDVANTQDQANTLTDEVRQADAEYARARDELIAALADERAALEPETRQILDENLAVIDDAIEEIRAALEQEPDNPRLIRMLVATQQKGLEVIGLTARLSEAM